MVTLTFRPQNQWVLKTSVVNIYKCQLPFKNIYSYGPETTFVTDG